VDTHLLLWGNELFSDDINFQIFTAVHKFIKNSERFYCNQDNLIWLNLWFILIIPMIIKAVHKELQYAIWFNINLMYFVISIIFHCLSRVISMWYDSLVVEQHIIYCIWERYSKLLELVSDPFVYRLIQ
jgi:hypothetical protein